MSPGDEEFSCGGTATRGFSHHSGTCAHDLARANSEQPGRRAGATGRRVPAPAVPRYSMALPGADNSRACGARPRARRHVHRHEAAHRTAIREASSSPCRRRPRPDVRPSRRARPGAPCRPSATTWYLVRVRPGRGGAMAEHSWRAARRRAAAGRRCGVTLLCADGKYKISIQPLWGIVPRVYLCVFSSPPAGCCRSSVRSAPSGVGCLRHAGPGWIAGAQLRRSLSLVHRDGGQYLGVRTLDVNGQGRPDRGRQLAWSVKDYLNVRRPTAHLRRRCSVTVTADGTVVAAPPACPAPSSRHRRSGVPRDPAVELGGLPRVSGGPRKPGRAVYRTGSNCVPGGDGVLGQRVGRALVGYIQYGEPPLTTTSVYGSASSPGARHTAAARPRRRRSPTPCAWSSRRETPGHARG